MILSSYLPNHANFPLVFGKNGKRVNLKNDLTLENTVDVMYNFGAAIRTTNGQMTSGALNVTSFAAPRTFPNSFTVNVDFGLAETSYEYSNKLTVGDHYANSNTLSLKYRITAQSRYTSGGSATVQIRNLNYSSDILNSGAHYFELYKERHRTFRPDESFVTVASAISNPVTDVFRTANDLLLDDIDDTLAISATQPLALGGDHYIDGIVSYSKQPKRLTEFKLLNEADDIFVNSRLSSGITEAEYEALTSPTLEEAVALGGCLYFGVIEFHRPLVVNVNFAFNYVVTGSQPQYSDANVVQDLEVKVLASKYSPFYPDIGISLFPFKTT